MIRKKKLIRSTEVRKDFSRSIYYYCD